MEEKKEEKNYFIELFNVNVNDKVEEKNGLRYVSWAYAWAEVKKLHPTANYKVYEDFNGCIYFTDGRTAWVKTGVIINDIEHIEYLPIMDYKNKSIPLENITSFDVNKTIQRSLTKAVARHGLGLYIYAGEDLPEEEQKEDKFAKQVKKNETPKQTIVKDDDLPFNDLKDEVDKFASTAQKFIDLHKEQKNIDVLQELRDMIHSKLYQMGKANEQTFNYFLARYKKRKWEDLSEMELRNVLAEVDERFEIEKSKKEAQ